jgi:hypothetical protein
MISKDLEECSPSHEFHFLCGVANCLSCIFVRPQVPIPIALESLGPHNALDVDELTCGPYYICANPV